MHLGLSVAAGLVASCRLYPATCLLALSHTGWLTDRVTALRCALVLAQGANKLFSMLK